MTDELDVTLTGTAGRVYAGELDAAFVAALADVIDWFANPLRDPELHAIDDDEPLRFHRALPGYARTELIDAPELAAEWDVGRVRLKFERERFGLPSFKFLGASWAARRLLGEPPHDPGLELIAATDGNHGRAVARVARLAGLGARILVPAGTATARIDAIAAEGAEVEVVDGSYDDAVRRSAGAARAACCSRTRPGRDTRTSRWVIEGYATIFREIDEQMGGAPVDVAVVPIGVGALAAAAVRHLAGRARLAGVEPATAACTLKSARAGEITEVPGPHLDHGRAERRPAVAGRLAAGERRVRPVLRDRGPGGGRGDAAPRRPRTRGGGVLGRRRRRGRCSPTPRT